MHAPIHWNDGWLAAEGAKHVGRSPSPIEGVAAWTLWHPYKDVLEAVAHALADANGDHFRSATRGHQSPGPLEQIFLVYWREPPFAVRLECARCSTKA
jgi:hypothetical protein